MVQGFGLIGNCSYSALVDAGRVVWLCWPRFDSSFVFGSLLDAERGGTFAVEPQDAGEVAVRVQASGRSVEVSVEDHGRGFETEGRDPVEGHLGLDMLRRRVADAHGTLDVSSAPGKGTRVVARLPVTDKE